MRSSTPLTRFGRLVVLGAVVAGVTASAAVAIPIVDPQDSGTATVAASVSRPPDVQDAASAAVEQTTPAGLKADGLRMQGIAQVYQHLQAAAPSVASRPPDVQDTASSLSASAPDVFERYVGVHAQDASSSSASVTRPPDVSDTALAVRYAPASTGSSDGFDWGSWAIGIGSGLGLVLLLGAALLMGRQLRHRVQTA